MELGETLSQIMELADVTIEDVWGPRRDSKIVAVKALFAQISSFEGYQDLDISLMIGIKERMIQFYCKRYKPTKEYYKLKQDYEQRLLKIN